ncbi:NAD-dependent epimerase/dehydratase family protein [Winogradskya consettensis]|uniref:NAD-dependent epimerase/dehydratase family protein n=1 Tax=Winogradskya consettensis TaxID=113560 RepID=UPI001BB41499|nr:NAD(P)-dependent oxidoreductase [Actinoplanes consettensis]
MRALVVGGSGFLGRHVSAALRVAGWYVVPVSRSAEVPLDLAACSTADLRALLRSARPDAIVNCAGLLWSAVLDPAALTAVNAKLPARLAAVAGGRRLVQLGSIYEYGDQRILDESTQEQPATPYGISKLAGTRAVLDGGGTVLRLGTAIGAGLPARSFLGGLAQRLRNAPPGEFTVPVAPGERDFLHAGDVAAAVLAALGAPGTGLYNVASGEPVAPRRLVESLVRVSAAPVHLRTVPAATTARGGTDRQLIRIEAAATGLGWHPRRNLNDAVADVWHSAQV